MRHGLMAMLLVLFFSNAKELSIFAGRGRKPRPLRNHIIRLLVLGEWDFAISYLSAL